MPIRSVTPTPVPPPATRPVVAIAEGDIRELVVRLTDEATPTRRARPSGTSGAEVYSFVAAASEQPPADLELWRYEGLATKSDFVVDFNQADVGKQASVVARWINPRGEVGPVSSTVTRTIAA